MVNQCEDASAGPGGDTCTLQLHSARENKVLFSKWDDFSSSTTFGRDWSAEKVCLPLGVVSTSRRTHLKLVYDRLLQHPCPNEWLTYARSLHM